MSIKVTNIEKIYGDQKALSNVCFEIKKGEIVGFLGPNGAGKSTMMKILTGYIPQTSGYAKICGIDPGENPLEAKRKIGYLPEHNPLYMDMFVVEYLEFIADIYKVDKTNIDPLLKKIGLNNEKHKKIGSLSKGYKQRVGLAQALIHNPEVLILDEPTTGLDPNQLVEIRALIKEIGKEKTVMLSTHIMQEVEAICDRIIIINKGNIVANKSIHSLQKNKGNRAIVTVEFGDNVPSKELEHLDNALKVVELSSKKFKIYNIANNF